MFRNVAFVAVYVAVLLVTAAPTQAAQYGTAEEAKAMLDRAVAAVKEDKAKADPDICSAARVPTFSFPAGFHLAL